jgi:hypothetical protein
MNMIMPSHHQARFYAEEHGNDAVEYRANSSEPWATCSPICAWNPAPFEYRKAAGRWTIDAETTVGVVVRHTFSQEELWAKSLKEYAGYRITITRRHAAVQHIKIAKWKDVPRLTRVTRIDGEQYEFLGVIDDRAALLKHFTTITLPFSAIKLAPNQLNMLAIRERTGFIEHLHNTGFSVSTTHHTFRILGLRIGWEMEQ